MFTVKTVMTHFSKFVGLKLSQLLYLLFVGTLNRFHCLPCPFCYVLTFLTTSSLITLQMWYDESVVRRSSFVSVSSFSMKKCWRSDYALAHTCPFHSCASLQQADSDQLTSSQQKPCMCLYLDFKEFFIILPLRSLLYLTFKQWTIQIKHFNWPYLF